MKLSDVCTTPKWCRWDPSNPPPFTIWLNLLYACAGGFTSANLYYSHPILHLLAEDFHTTQAGVANIPTLALAGNATGLLLILPLADFFPRRTFTITLLSLAIAFWLGLCLAHSLPIFLALTYLSAVFTGIPQIMLPLVAELSTDANRASNISIVATGPTLGILLARILSGIVANYTNWRNIYWLALGLQCIIIILLYLFMPDYPATNPTPPRAILKSYPSILLSILTLYPSHPVLVQACLLAFSTFFTVSSYWTTLTFLLSAPPYNYNTFIIGLFGLIGASTLVLGPIYGRYIVTPLSAPLLSAAIGKAVSLTGIIIGTFVGVHSVAGPVIQAVLLDAGLMILQISNRIAIHGVEPKQRNRVNTAFVSVLYLGSLTGTKAGNQVYQRFGRHGWIASGCLSIGVIGIGFLVILARGPHEERWVGWSGGWGRGPRRVGDDGNREGMDGEVEKGIEKCVAEEEKEKNVEDGAVAEREEAVKIEIRKKLEHEPCRGGSNKQLSLSR